MRVPHLVLVATTILVALQTAPAQKALSDEVRARRKKSARVLPASRRAARKS